MSTPSPFQTWTRLAIGASLLLSAWAQGVDAFDEMHIGVNQSARILAVTVVAKDLPLWRLWPEEVKVKYSKDEGDYTISYSKDGGPIRLLGTATGLSESCRAEIRRLAKKPETPVSEDKLTTTVYVEIKDETPARLAIRATNGLKIVDIRPLESFASSKNAKLELETWSRGAYVEVITQTPASQPVGPSDIVVTGNPETGDYSVSLQKAGLTALTRLTADGALTPACSDSLSKKPWGLSVGFLKRFFPVTQSSFVLIPIPSAVPRTISVKTGTGVTLKQLGSLD